MVSYETYSQTTDLLQLPTRFKGYYNNSTDILQTCYRGLWDLQNYSFYSNSMGMLLVCHEIYKPTASYRYHGKGSEFADDEETSNGCTHMVVFLCLLIGLVASVVVYVGCFSIVQNLTSTIGPGSRLCLEVGLFLNAIGSL